MLDRYDVIVAGGGPSGVAAAVYAAKNGAKTLLVERAGVLGGMATLANVNVWCGSASSGLYKKISPLVNIDVPPRRWINLELLKNVYLDQVLEAGAELLLQAMVNGVEVRDGYIQNITVSGKGRIFKINAKVYIDSTGDGDLAFMAEVPFEIGRPGDGLTQPASIIFMLGGIDEDRAVYPVSSSHPEFQALMKKAVENGEILPPAGHVHLGKAHIKGSAGVNMTVVTGIDGGDLESVTRAEILARRQIPGIVNFLRKNLPGFKDCYVLNSGTFLGVRESRRFRGDYQLIHEDIMTNRVFDDWVVSRADYVFGVHNPAGSGINIDRDTTKIVYNHKGYTIPYGCFLPRGIENLYLNGRNISGTHMAHSSYRIMPICMAMGQAVGTAASLAVKNGGRTRAADVKELQKILLSQEIEPPGDK
jgi:hypothetical protein